MFITINIMKCLVDILSDVLGGYEKVFLVNQKRYFKHTNLSQTLYIDLFWTINVR